MKVTILDTHGTYLVLKDLLGIRGITAGVCDPCSNDFTIEKKLSAN